jgi:hypothetical protein
MARYVVHGHSWFLISRLDIQDTLFRGWTLVMDKMNYEFIEAPEFQLRAYSSPLNKYRVEVTINFKYCCRGSRV